MSSTLPVSASSEGTRSQALRGGSALMGLGAILFVAYAVIFFVRNFTDSFIELGIGPDQVDKSKTEIQTFSPSLYDYIGHLHIAVSGFIAASAVAVLFLVWFGVRRGQLWAWIGAVVTPVVGLAVALPAHWPYGLATLAISALSSSQLGSSSRARCLPPGRSWKGPRWRSKRTSTSICSSRKSGGRTPPSRRSPGRISSSDRPGVGRGSRLPGGARAGTAEDRQLRRPNHARCCSENYAPLMSLFGGSRSARACVRAMQTRGSLGLGATPAPVTTDLPARSRQPQGVMSTLNPFLLSLGRRGDRRRRERRERADTAPSSGTSVSTSRPVHTSSPTAHRACRGATLRRLPRRMQVLLRSGHT